MGFKPVVLVAGVCVILYLMHRLALWLESRGWLYYLNSKPSPSSAGNAMLELQSLAEPLKKHILEIKREEQVEEEESGDPPEKTDRGGGGRKG